MTDVKHPGGLLAPFSQEAEEATLGAVLTSGMVYEDLASFLSADSFYLTRHRYLWETFARLHKDRLIIDMTTVSEDLRQRVDPSSKTPLLEIIGGYAYIVHLINNTPNSMHAEAYGRLVERTATRRKLLVAADTIRAAALDEGKHIDTVLND
jgi:replicative DNA helicase